MRIKNSFRELLSLKQDTVQDGKERVPILKQASCLGAKCVYFAGHPCESRLELLEATGKSGGVDLGPYTEESSYALYGRVCTGGKENVVVALTAESPNGTASPAEIVARLGQLEGQKIVLTPRQY